ncbi:MAG: hypothetical protein R3F43_07725 [bacterium]
MRRPPGGWRREHPRRHPGALNAERNSFLQSAGRGLAQALRRSRRRRSGLCAQAERFARQNTSAAARAGEAAQRAPRPQHRRLRGRPVLLHRGLAGQAASPEETDLTAPTTRHAGSTRASASPGATPSPRPSPPSSTAAPSSAAPGLTQTTRWILEGCQFPEADLLLAPRRLPSPTWPSATVWLVGVEWTAVSPLRFEARFDACDPRLHGRFGGLGLTHARFTDCRLLREGRLASVNLRRAALGGSDLEGAALGADLPATPTCAAPALPAPRPRPAACGARVDVPRHWPSCGSWACGRTRRTTR